MKEPDDNTATRFGCVPYAVVDAGAVARMTHADAKTYLCLAAHVGRDWTARPSLDRLAKLAGLTRRAVCASVQRLIHLGVIRTIPGGGRGRVTVYHLATNSERGNTVSGAQTVNADARNSERRRAETVNGRARNSVSGFTPTSMNIVEHQQNIRAAAPPAAAAADVHADQDRAGVRAELAAGGIDQRGIARMLAELPGLTLPAVRAARARVNGTAKNPGAVLVTILRSDGPYLIRQAADQMRAAQTRERRATEQRQERAAAISQAASEREERQRIIADLEPEHLERLISQAIAEAKPLQVREWAHRDVAKSRGLAIAVAALARAESAAGGAA